MSITSKIARAVYLSVLVGCGPGAIDDPTWIIGTFSGGLPNATVSTITRYRFYEDHRVEFEREVYCETEPKVWTMLWEARGENAIAFKPAPGEDVFPDTTSFANHIIQRGGTCGPHEWYVTRNDGSAALVYTLRRGALCTQLLPPCPGELCDECVLVWCDEEPPPCEDES